MSAARLLALWATHPRSGILAAVGALPSASAASACTNALRAARPRQDGPFYALDSSPPVSSSSAARAVVFAAATLADGGAGSSTPFGGAWRSEQASSLRSAPLASRFAYHGSVEVGASAGRARLVEASSPASEPIHGTSALSYGAVLLQRRSPDTRGLLAAPLSGLRRFYSTATLAMPPKSAVAAAAVEGRFADGPPSSRSAWRSEHVSAPHSAQPAPHFTHSVGKHFGASVARAREAEATSPTLISTRLLSLGHPRPSTVTAPLLTCAPMARAPGHLRHFSTSSDAAGSGSSGASGAEHSPDMSAPSATTTSAAAAGPAAAPAAHSGVGVLPDDAEIKTRKAFAELVALEAAAKRAVAEAEAAAKRAVAEAEAAVAEAAARKQRAIAEGAAAAKKATAEGDAAAKKATAEGDAAAKKATAEGDAAEAAAKKATAEGDAAAKKATAEGDAAEMKAVTERSAAWYEWLRRHFLAAMALLLAIDYVFHKVRPVIRWRMKHTILTGDGLTGITPREPSFVFKLYSPSLVDGLASLLLGHSGTGKTFSLWQLVQQLRKRGVPTVFVSLRGLHESDKSNGATSPSGGAPAAAQDPLEKLTAAAELFYGQIGYPSRPPILEYLLERFAVSLQRNGVKFIISPAARTTDRFKQAVSDLFAVCAEIRAERMRDPTIPAADQEPVICFDELHDLEYDHRLRDIGGHEVFSTICDNIVRANVDNTLTRCIAAASSFWILDSLAGQVASSNRWFFQSTIEPEEKAVRARLAELQFTDDQVNAILEVCGLRLRLLRPFLAVEKASDVDVRRILDLTVGTAEDFIRQLFALDPNLAPGDRKQLVRVLDKLHAEQPAKVDDLPQALRVPRTSHVIFRGYGGRLSFQSACFHKAWMRVRHEFV